MTSTMRKINEGLPEACPSIILILSSIFSFGPYTIYSGNVGEFFLPLPTILAQLFLPAMIVLLPEYFTSEKG